VKLTGGIYLRHNPKGRIEADGQGGPFNTMAYSDFEYRPESPGLVFQWRASAAAGSAVLNKANVCSMSASSGVDAGRSRSRSNSHQWSSATSIGYAAMQLRAGPEAIRCA